MAKKKVASAETMPANTEAPANKAEAPLAYKIIRGTDMLDLADAVNAAIYTGEWRAEGGVTHVPVTQIDLISGGVPHPFWQVMVRTYNP